jgi:cell pole-organizing protein PopZ
MSDTFERALGISWEKAEEIAAFFGRRFPTREICQTLRLKKHIVESVRKIIEDKDSGQDPDFRLRKAYLDAEAAYENAIVQVPIANRQRQLQELQEALDRAKSLEQHFREAFLHNLRMAKARSKEGHRTKAPKAPTQLLAIMNQIVSVISEARKMTADPLSVRGDFVTPETFNARVDEALDLFLRLIKENAIARNRVIECLKPYMMPPPAEATRIQ